MSPYFRVTGSSRAAVKTETNFQEP